MKREGQVLVECLIAAIFLAIIVPHVSPAAQEAGGFGRDQQEAYARATLLNRKIEDQWTTYCSNAREAIKAGVKLPPNLKMLARGCWPTREALLAEMNKWEAARDPERFMKRYKIYCHGQVPDDDRADECNKLAAIIRTLP